MNTTLIIVITIISLLLVTVGIIKMIPWRDLFEKYFGNNPEKARVFIEIGEEVKPVNGELSHAGINGDMYRYKYRKLIFTVDVPADYPYKFLHGRRLIRVNYGEVVAKRFDEKTDGQGGAYDVDILLRSQIAVQLVKSVSGSKAIPWLIIGIAAVVLVAGYFVVKNMTGSNKVPVPPTPTPTLPVEKPSGYLGQWEVIYV
jgi:hypothetical protein